MERFIAPLSIKIIYVLNEIIFWLFSLVLVGAIVFSVVILAGGLKNDLQLHAGLPIAFNSDATGFIMAANTAYDVQIVEAYGKLHFINTPPYIAKRFVITMLFACGIMFFILFTIRMFMRNVRKGLIFEYKNIRLLRRLSYILLGFWGFTKLYSWMMMKFVVSKLHIGTVEFSNQYQNFNYLLIISLFIWALSHIFIVGQKLREENTLTI